MPQIIELRELNRYGKILSIGFLCLFFVPLAHAQKVWTLDIAGSSPTGYLDVGVLESLQVGDSFDLRVDRTYIYPVQIDGTSVASNGDRSWYGSITNTGLDYALVITVGELTAHIILTSPSGIFQLYGRKSSENRYAGAFVLLEHVRDEVASTDIILPVDQGNPDAGEPSFTDFLIEQNVSESIALLGSKLTFGLTFTNKSSQIRQDLYADIFFVLENTTLEGLPALCEILETTDMQPVLSCELGDLAVGEKKQLSFTVNTSEESHPLVYSTVIVDEDRSDLIVEIYRDVITDTDEDGVSDYNEGLLGTDFLNALDNDELDTTIIDVLVAYTSDITNFYSGEVDTRINQLFNVANKIFADSETGIILRPVGVHEVNYQPEEALFDDLATITFQTDEALKDLSRKRELYGGDLVVLFRSGEINGLCGLANLGGKGTNGDLSADYHKDFSYSVINIDCLDDSVLAHEIGHNMGLVHSRFEDPEGGTLPYSSGHGEEGRFVTIMAFPEDYEVVNRLYRFSDPQRQCGPFACGADTEETEGADAVSTLRLVKHQVAKYFSSQEERIRTIKAASNFSGAIDGSLGMGAYSNNSTDFEQLYSAEEKISIQMKITPPPEQIGKEFVPHFVVYQNKQFLFQLNGDGSLIPWPEASLKTLKPVTEARAMGSSELFNVVSDFDFKSAGVTGSLRIYLAYRMVETGEVIYTASPFFLTVED